MTEVIPQRMTVEIDGDFVVFLIGMRINKPLKVHKWLPVFMAMPRMLKELEQRPSEETGFLGYRQGLTFIAHYWRSFDHLEAYARDRNSAHWPAWVAFNRNLGRSRGDVGIWHETFCVKAGQYEAIYSGTPPQGLGKIGRMVKASEARDSARGRVEAATQA
jgi:hypothetical protein